MKKEITLYQDNILTQSRNDFSPIEKNCIYLIIEEIQKKYISSNIGQKDLFDNLIIQFKGSQLGRAVSNRSPKDAYNALKRLKNRNNEIETENEWLYVGYINYVEHIKKTDTYEIEISKKILPYLLELTHNNQFTSYQLTVALTLRSQYSKRFYELCNQYKNQKLANGSRWFFLTVDHLREIFMLTNKYNDSYAFKNRVIDVAQKELQTAYLNENSDLYFTYNLKDKEGKKEISYNFYIHTRDDEESNALNYTTLPQIIARINSILTSYIKRNTPYIRRVVSAVQINPSIAQSLLEKLLKISEKYDRKEIAPVIYYVFNEDFGISSK